MTDRVTVKLRGRVLVVPSGEHHGLPGDLSREPWHRPIPGAVAVGVRHRGQFPQVPAAVPRQRSTDAEERTTAEHDPAHARLVPCRRQRSAILLVAGDKAQQWNRWYERAIPHAEHLYEIYLKERGEEEAGR